MDIKEKKMADKLRYIASSLSRGTHKKYETYVINAIYTKLNNFELEIVTQKYVHTNNGVKYIDLYFPQIKYAIEVDEFYHDSDTQHQKDNIREEDIKSSILESCIADEYNLITFKRVVIYGNDLASVDKQINDIVDEINKVVSHLKEPLKWRFDQDDINKDIINRGYLKFGDSFTLMKDILFIFNKHVEAWMKSTYKINEKDEVWSPTLSFDGSSCGGWKNVISKDLKTIYEYGDENSNKIKTKQDIENAINNGRRRVTFIKYKDCLGNKKRRFIGVFVCSGYDESRKAQIWSLQSDTYKIS